MTAVPGSAALAAEQASPLSPVLLGELSLLLVALVLGLGVVARRASNDTSGNTERDTEASRAAGPDKAEGLGSAPFLRLIKNAPAEPPVADAEEPASDDVSPPKRTA